MDEDRDAHTIMELDLSNQQLPALPPKLFDMALLHFLNLSGNRLTSLPTELFDLQLL